MSRKRNISFRRAAIVGAACVVGPACIGLASCSLALDESLLDRRVEASTIDVQQPDVLVPEGGDGALPPIKPEAGVCAKDEDCKGTAGCLTAKCDVPRKACVLEVCHQPACNSAACDMASQKCSTSKPYKYRATQFPVNVEGLIVSDLTVSPAVLTLGTLQPGQKVTKQIVVKGTKPFKIIEVRCEDAFTFETCLVVSQNSWCRFGTASRCSGLK